MTDALHLGSQLPWIGVAIGCGVTGAIVLVCMIDRFLHRKWAFSIVNIGRAGDESADDIESNLPDELARVRPSFNGMQHDGLDNSNIRSMTMTEALKPHRPMAASWLEPASALKLDVETEGAESDVPLDSLSEDRDDRPKPRREVTPLTSGLDSSERCCIVQSTAAAATEAVGEAGAAGGAGVQESSPHRRRRRRRVVTSNDADCKRAACTDEQADDEQKPHRRRRRRVGGSLDTAGATTAEISAAGGTASSADDGEALNRRPRRHHRHSACPSGAEGGELANHGAGDAHEIVHAHRRHRSSRHSSSPERTCLAEACAEARAARRAHALQKASETDEALHPGLEAGEHRHRRRSHHHGTREAPPTRLKRTSDMASVADSSCPGQQRNRHSRDGDSHRHHSHHGHRRLSRSPDNQHIRSSRHKNEDRGLAA